MTSLLPLRVVIELGRPSLRLLLRARRNLCQHVRVHRNRVIQATQPDAYATIGPDARHLPLDLDAVAFGNLFSHNEYLEREGARAR